MNNTTNQNNRELWLNNGADMLIKSVITPALAAINKSELIDSLKFVVSIGHPQSKRSIGECWKKSASEDKETSHIFITPACNDSTRVLDVLLHELIHALDDCESGHKNFFAKMARKCGLVGKLTATTAGEDLQDTLLDIIDVLGGDIPHHALESGAQRKPKQKSRMLKIECEDCGFNFRTARTNILRLTADSVCPCCDRPTLSNSIHEALAN